MTDPHKMDHDFMDQIKRAKSSTRVHINNLMKETEAH